MIMNAQDVIDSFPCKGLIETKMDKMTGKTSTATKDYISVGRGAFNILLLSDGPWMVTFNVNAGNDIGCVDSGNEVYILFRDGTRLVLHHDLGFNCRGDFTINLKPMPQNAGDIRLLATKEIETIRVYSMSSNKEKDLTVDESKTLMDAFHCFFVHFKLDQYEKYYKK